MLELDLRTFRMPGSYASTEARGPSHSFFEEYYVVTDGKRVDSTFIFGHWDTFQLLHEVLPQVQLQKLQLTFLHSV